MNEMDDLRYVMHNDDLSELLAAWSESQQLTDDESENIRHAVLEQRMDRHAYRMAIQLHRINRSVERSNWIANHSLQQRNRIKAYRST